MPGSRWWSLACLALACATAPLAIPEPAPPPTPARPAAPTPAPSFGWEPLRPIHAAELAAPAEPSAPAYDAAADAASQAGVLDVAAHWRAAAHALEPTTARAEALAAARQEAGFAVASDPKTMLDRDLAGPLRAATEAHAWDQVLALLGPALATSPNHELWYRAGDALWQQGHEVQARQMWSRARVQLRVERAPFSLRPPPAQDVGELAWTRAGPGYLRKDSLPWVEVWDDRLERPWRRWQIHRANRLAWSDTVVAISDGTTLGIHDPMTGAALATTRAHADRILHLVAATRAPVFATAAPSGEIKVWRWSTDAPLAPAEVLAPTARTAAIALDPTGTHLAIARLTLPIELYNLETRTPRRLAHTPTQTSTTLRFAGETTLLVADDTGTLVRLDLDPTGDTALVLQATAADTPPPLRLLGAADTGELVLLDTVRTQLATCGIYLQDCRDRVADPGVLRHFTRASRHDSRPRVGEATFSRDSGRLAVAAGRTLIVHDLTTGARTSLVKPVDGSPRVAGANHGGTAIVVEAEHGLAIWDTRTDAKLLTRDRRGFLGFSPDGTRVALRVDNPLRVEIAALTGGEPTRLTIAGPQPPRLRFAPDGRRVALLDGDRLGVWDAASGAELWTEVPPERVYSLEFTARNDLVFETGDGLYIRDAADELPPRLLMRTGDDAIDWSVAPGGGELLVCREDARSVALIDLATRKTRRSYRGGCAATYLDADTAYVHNDEPALLDLRTGKRTPAGHIPVSRQVLGRVVASTASHLGGFIVYSRDGRELVRLRARADLGWYAVTPEGAVDGDAAAIVELDTEVTRGLTQRWPAALAWDGAHVPGLVPRAFAGERVAPPVTPRP